MDCIFCKILNGDIPSYKIYEDENCLAILDISQTTRGHTIIISKKHFKNLYEVTPEDAAKIFSIVPKLARALNETLEPIGMNVLINADKPLQTVMHFHIHLIPRYEDDQIKMSFVNNMNKVTKEMFTSLQTEIQKAIK